MPVSAMTSNGKTKATPEVKLAVLGRAGVGKSGKIFIYKSSFVQIASQKNSFQVPIWFSAHLLKQLKTLHLFL